MRFFQVLEVGINGNTFVNQSFWHKLIFALAWFALFPFLALLALIAGCASLPPNVLYDPKTERCDCAKFWEFYQYEINQNKILGEKIKSLEGECGKWVYKFCEEEVNIAN